MSKAKSDNVVHTQGRIDTVEEKDYRGNTTGNAFFRCQGCGAEIMTGAGRDALEHKSGCPVGGNGR